jgi:hypothetical protein
MNRWTPLHLAAIRDYTQVLGVLLERGADVDIGTEIDGDWTPLMEGCRSGSVHAVAALIQHGADEEIPNSWGFMGIVETRAARRSPCGSEVHPAGRAQELITRSDDEYLERGGVPSGTRVAGGVEAAVGRNADHAGRPQGALRQGHLVPQFLQRGHGRRVDFGVD